MKNPPPTEAMIGTASEITSLPFSPSPVAFEDKQLSSERGPFLHRQATRRHLSAVSADTTTRKHTLMIDSAMNRA